MNLDPLAHIQLFLSVPVSAQDLHTLVGEPRGSSDSIRYMARKGRLKADMDGKTGLETTRDR
jgi:hypothetical protein